MISHLGYKHDTAQLLCRVGDAIWQMGVPDQRFSMLYVRVDPETGEGEVASSGQFAAIVGSRHGHRPLVSPDGRPLGTDFETTSNRNRFQLQEGECLLVRNAAFLSGRGSDAVGRSLRDGLQSGSIQPLARVRRFICGDAAPTSERAAATLLRRSPGGSR